MLHAGVISRPIILTVPALCRPTCSHNASVVVSALMRCGVQCMDDFSRDGRGKALRGGSIVVIHTHGRPGPSRPPRPLIATLGGDEGPGARWEHLQYCGLCAAASAVASAA